MKIKELYEKIRDGIIISDIELQREIIYNTEKQVLVIDSIINNVPLPAFYLWQNENGKLEVLDGKQRIEAIRKFIENDLEYNGKIWKQSAEIHEIFNMTELSVIICSGDEQLKRKIFNRINTLGVPLSPYEVLNGLYNGEYLRGLSSYVSADKDALKVFGTNSRGKNQMKALKFLCILKEVKDINDYVEENQNLTFANDQRLLMKYIKFVRDVFDEYGQIDIYFSLAIKYLKDYTIWKENKQEINLRVKRYLKSDDSKFTDKRKEIEDIIQAVVNGISVDEKRLFTIDDKKNYLSTRNCENGKYQCEICHKWFYPEELQMDHIEAWSKGGRTVLSNAQVLCSPCNKKKSNF